MTTSAWACRIRIGAHLAAWWPPFAILLLALVVAGLIIAILAPE